MTGRIDVHSHLLPGIDDGCKTVEESLFCARELVAAGYTHCFCTPHIWPNLPKNTVEQIPRLTSELQRALDEAQIPLRLIAGGEINLRVEPRQIVTYGMAGRYVLIDLWAETLPEHFAPAVRWLQSAGLTVILAHPERMRAVQDGPRIADYFQKLGLLLQGNLQCFADPLGSRTRVTVERFMREDRYFMLGSDLHGPGTMPSRLQGLRNAIEVAGAEKIDQLTIENPRRLLADVR
jgi:protein-tyrosine phosphatase